MDTANSKVVKDDVQTKRAHRVIDIRLESGYEEKNVLYENIDDYILMIDEGDEDFLVLTSQDGFVQFFGIDNQFVGGTRVDFSDDDFREYSFINKEKEQRTNRITFTTPYGEFTPQEREVVSLDVIRMIVKKYYENTDYEEFIKQIPCVDTTEEIKRCMGLIK